MSCTKFDEGVLCTANKKGGEEARGFTTVRGAPQNGDGRVEADFAIMRLTAQPRNKFCIFFKGGAKNCSKTREMQMTMYTSRFACKNRLSCLRRSAFSAELKSSICWTWTVMMRRRLWRCAQVTRVRAPIIRPTESDHAERSTSEAVFCVVSSTVRRS